MQRERESRREQGGVAWGKEKGEAAEKGGGREGRATTATQGGKTQQKEHARSHFESTAEEKKEIKKEN